MATKAHKRKKGVPRWAHTPVYAGVRAAGALMNIVGAEPSMRAMRRLADLYATSPLNKGRLRRAAENISWCFPSWDADLVREYAVESYRHLFCLVAEVALTPRLLNQDGFATHVELGNLRDSLRSLCGRRPSILITGHCGNWELLGYTVAMLGFPMHALYRPLDIAALDSWVHDSRSRRGLELIDKFGAADFLPALLHSGRPAAFIADQNAGDRGIFVPYFNRLASAYKTIGLLAMRYNADVICGHARRLSGFSSAESILTPTLTPTPAPFLIGSRPQARFAEAPPPARRDRDSQTFRYAIDIVDTIHPRDWQDQPDPLFYITARYRRAIEMMVRRAPEQCLWMHRYWKSRPPHERKGHAFPAQLREKIAALPWIDDDDVQRIVERSARDAHDFADNRPATSRHGPPSPPSSTASDALAPLLSDTSG